MKEILRKAVQPFSFIWRAIALTLVLCMTGQAWAAAPVPVVVWDGAAGAEYNFSNRSKTVGDVTYYIENIGEGTDNTSVNICAADSSYIQVVNQDWGVAAPVIKASGTGSETAFGSTGGSTVIVKCEFLSGANISAPNRAVLGFLSQSAQTYGYLHLGITKYKGYEAAVYSMKNGSDSGSGSLGGNAYAAGSHTLAMTYKYDTALKCYGDGVSKYTWDTPDSTFTAPGGICIGGVDYTDNANRFYTMKCMKIYAIAIFDSELTQEQIADYAFPSSIYSTFDYVNKMVTWKTPTDGTSNSTDMGVEAAKFNLLDKNRGVDATSYNGNEYVSAYGDEMFWTTFFYGKDNSIPRTTRYTSPNYSAPGMALRLVSGYKAEIGASFGPLTFGGLLVEDGASGYGFIQTSGSNRHTIFGDPRATGGVPTWFVVKESIGFNRVGSMYIVGTANFDIDENCTVNLNNPDSGGNDNYAPAIYASIGKGAESPVAGGELIMHGLGNISVRKLTASGAKLNYSNLTAGRLDTSDTTKAYIQGNLVIDGNTSFAFPAGMAKNTKYALCSGTLTNGGDASRTATITVGEDTFDAILTFDTSDATVSYVPIYEATIEGDTAFSGITWTPALDSATGCKFKIHGSGKVTGLFVAPASVEIDSGVTLDVTAIASESTTLSGSGTFLYTSSYPTTVPAGFTYEYVGSNTEGSPASQAGVTVSGTLKTSGYLSLTTFSLASTGTLDVLDNKTTVSGSAAGLAGTVIVREDATLATASDAMPNYNGTTTAHIYGTLDAGSSGRWCLYANNTVNLYAGATVKGTPSGGAINICKKAGLNIKAHPTDETKTEVYFQGKLKYNRNDTTLAGGSIITVDEGVALVFSGVVTSHDNHGGYVRKQGAGKIKFVSGAIVSSFGVYLNVEEGAIELGGVTLGGGSSGFVSVADGAFLEVSGNSTISLPLTLADGAAIKVGDEGGLTASGAVTLPTGEGESVTLDLNDYTLPTGTASSTILTASATLDLDVGRFEFDGATSDYYLTQNTTTGAVSIKLHVAKGSDGAYRDNLMEALGEIVDAHDLVITVLDGTGATNAELVKSANIAWDSDNNQFLYGYAKIGSEPYISLAAAIAASTTGDTITLLRNTAENVAIKNGTTLSLNGFTVGSVSAEAGYVLVPDDAENPTSYSTVEAKVSLESGGNTRYFETLSDALTAAAGTGTITLLAACSENAELDTGVTLVLDGNAYTGSLSGSGTIVLSSLTAPTFGATWTGTVELPADQNFSETYFDNYGVSGSTVRLKGTNRGWFYYKNTKDPVATTIEIPQDASLTVTGWSPSFANAFEALKGAGTFAVNITSGTGTTGDGYSDYFLLKNVSNFTGSLSASGAGIAIGNDRIANSVAGGKIIVSSGKSATIASGATWQTSSGFSVDGALTCYGGIMYGTGAAGTLALGGSGVITNKFEGGSAQCFNAGAITVSDSLSVVLVGGWSSFGTWTLSGTSSLGFDPGADAEFGIGASDITSAGKNNTIHIYGNGENVVYDYGADGTKDAAIHIHNGGVFQVGANGGNDILMYDSKDSVGQITVDAGGELRLRSRETYTRNTVLNGGTITLNGIQSSRSIDIHNGPTFTISDDSTIEAKGASHWIYLRNAAPTFNVAADKTLTVNASFTYDGSSNQNLIKTGSGAMVVNGYSGDVFTQPKGVDIQAGTYELNAVQNSNGQTGDNANFYTVASGAKLKVGATGQVNTTTMTLTDGSLLEFGASNATLINADTVTFSSGEATVSLSDGVAPANGTKLISWTTAPAGGSFTLTGYPLYHVVSESDGLYLMKKPGTIFSVY